MISKRELAAVDKRPQYVQYPGTNYSEKTMEILIESYNLYLKNYNGKEYSIIFSDGKEINFEIQPKNLSHLLGLYFKDLTLKDYDEFRENVLGFSKEETIGSFDLLTRVVNNSEKVLEYDYNNRDLPVINSFRVNVKCRIFSKLSNFEEFNFGCINFDKDTYAQNTTRYLSSHATNYLFVPSNEVECPYFMMGIRLGNETNGNNFISETLIAPQNPEDYFNHQEVVIPTQIIISTSKEFTKINASASEKIALLNIYKSLVHKYKMPYSLNINGDYEAMLVEMDNTKKLTK